MIILRDITLRRGTKVLFRAATATIQPGQRLALIGANGSGKSSLFSLLLGELGADEGEIDGLHGLRLAHMAQEVHADRLPAGDYVLQGDAVVWQLHHQLRRAEAAEDFVEAAQLHSQLEQHNGYDAPRKVRLLLQGLGFSDTAFEQAVSDFSGGWRIRLNLARALMTPSDLLLLDEPTNHLDLDATLWLQQWLLAYPGTLLMISHDRDFIDTTCERILQIEGEGVHSYAGNYSQFERQRAERLANQQALFEKQQRRITEIDSFVRRFRYKATKARQAQSRLKELERMQEVAPAHLDSPFSFAIPTAEKTSDPLLQLSEATLGYGSTRVLSGIDLALRPGSRLGLLGRNGAGKSTLLKSLVGELPLLTGHRVGGEHCRMGYFDQQQLEVLDLNASAALHLQRLSPDAREQEILNFLGGFNFHGDTATGDIAPFSGGEKARLALAMVVWQQPNLLVLDEPTNHLDLEMRHALEVALQSYDGAVILVTHDRHLLRNTVEELWLVHDGRADLYEGDLDAYERWVITQYDEPREHTVAPQDASRKSRRQQAAAERERLRPLTRALSTLETAMEKTNAALAAVELSLADGNLYSEQRKSELTENLSRQADLKSQALQQEDKWLALQEELEALQSDQVDPG